MMFFFFFCTDAKYGNIKGILMSFNFYATTKIIASQTIRETPFFAKEKSAIYVCFFSTLSRIRAHPEGGSTAEAAWDGTREAEGKNGVHVEARTHIAGEGTPRPPPSCAEVPSFRLIDIDSKMAARSVVRLQHTYRPILRATPPLVGPLLPSTLSTTHSDVLIHIVGWDRPGGDGG